MGRTRQVSFIHHDGALYREAPRIVHVSLPDAAAEEPQALGIIFSTAVVVMASEARAELIYDDGTPALLSEPCRSAGRSVTCEIAAAVPDGTLRAVRLPDAIVGVNGELATGWGSVSDLIAFHR
jgi:hypothetical protein